MTLEREYYENEAFWTKAAVAKETERFETTARHIPGDARTILDVGCGNGAFVSLLASMPDRFDEIHATDRSIAALRQVSATKTQSSIDALPFQDRFFDIVTALEVIEHLPLSIYQAGLANICRVASKYVMLSVPNEENLEARLVTCPACKSRFNPNYHMRSFDASKMQSLLAPMGFEPLETFYMGAKRRYFLVSRLIERPWDFPRSIRCPVCGGMVPPAVGEASEPRAIADVKARDGWVQAAVKRLLYVGLDYGWVATLYRRVT